MHTGRAALLFILSAIIVWFFSPVPTIAARYVWSTYQAGTLALALDRADADLAFSIGTAHFGSQPTVLAYDPALAERAFAKAIRIDPSLPLAHYMHARVAFVRADFDAALADLDAELALAPANKRTLYMRALTYAYRGAQGDLALAETDFRDFVAWAPHEWAGYNDLAYVLAKEKKYADAVPILKKGIATADGGAENPWLFNTLGVMELNLREPSAALAAFEKAQTLAKSLTEADWQRAYPGNDPATAASGLEAMKRGIERNIVAAYEARAK